MRCARLLLSLGSILERLAGAELGRRARLVPSGRSLPATSGDLPLSVVGGLARGLSRLYLR